MSDSVQERPYQLIARDRVFEQWSGGTQSTLLVLPTGTGKTVVAGMIHRQALDRHGRRGLFLAHREELVTQAVDKLSRFDLTASVEMGTFKARQADALLGKSDVVVATVQTMQSHRLRTWDPREFGVITIDEAHHARAKTYRNILNWFNGYWLLGITATPDRGDRRNLGAVFDSLAYHYPLKDAIQDGYLVPLVGVRLRTNVDLRQVKTTGGDYNQADLEVAVGPHVEALARTVYTESGARPTVVFTPDVGSAEMMADALRQLGKKAEAVSGKTPKPIRRDRLQRFRQGDFQALCCCDLLIEGWDEPQVSCVAICRPTKLRNRYTQMIGRGTRPCPGTGKADCLVLDFAWETTSDHELCTLVDLYDDEDTDDEVLAVAQQLLKERKEADPRQLLEEAEEVVRERRTFTIRLTGHRAAYTKFTYDPTGVGHLVGVAIKEGWDFDAARPASEGQLLYLRELGVAQPEGLSRSGAGKLIKRLSERRRAGLAEPKQLVLLESLGMDPDQARTIDRKTAGRAASDLLRHHIKGKT